MKSGVDVLLFRGLRVGVLAANPLKVLNTQYTESGISYPCIFQLIKSSYGIDIKYASGVSCKALTLLGKYFLRLRGSRFMIYISYLFNINQLKTFGLCPAVSLPCSLFIIDSIKETPTRITSDSIHNLISLHLQQLYCENL